MNWIAILAGGGGTRLWPLSRRERPKQFLPLLGGGETLLAATVRRTLPLAPISRTLVITAAPQVAEVRRALPDLPAENVVAEPVARNTAPAIGLGALEVLRRDPTGVMAVFPSDQFIGDEAAFQAAVQSALDRASRGDVVAIGIRPTHAETGYGYLHCPSLRSAPGPIVIERFVEKPDRAAAERYVSSGEYLWNAGMFFFPAKRILDEIRAHVPQLANVLDTGAPYESAPSISIDYAVMEKLGGKMWAVPGALGWNDVGSFAALADVRPHDAKGNSVWGEAILRDAKNNVIFSDGKMQIAAVGVQDLVVVATERAVLVLPRSRAQDVKQIVETLTKAGRNDLL